MTQPRRKPRSTALSRKQLQVARDSLAILEHDPVIRTAWGHLSLLTAEALGLSVDPIPSDDLSNVLSLREMLGDEASNAFYALARLEMLFRNRAREFALLTGPFCRGWILAMVTFELTGEVPQWIPLKFGRLLPDIPLSIDANNKIEGWELVPTKDWERTFRPLRDYKRSREPPGRRGRPPKTKATPQNWRIDPILARQAYEIFSEHDDWKTVARKVLHIPEATLRDAKKCGAIRNRVARLIDRGETLAKESS
jgi:hypothetical protein